MTSASKQVLWALDAAREILGYGPHALLQGEDARKVESVAALIKKHCPFEEWLERKRAESKYGVPAGTREYTRRYYSDPENRAKQRARSRKAAAERRERVRQIRAHELDSTTLAEMKSDILLPDRRLGSDDDKLFAKLNDPGVLAELAKKAHELVLDEMHEGRFLSLDEASERVRNEYIQSQSPVTLSSEATLDTDPLEEEM